MQISRHWRKNALRYRLEGVRYEDGTASVQSRPVVHPDEAERETLLPAAEAQPHPQPTFERVRLAS